MIFRNAKHGGLVIDRPWSVLYLIAICIASSVWLGWPGFVVAIAASIDMKLNVGDFDWIRISL